MVWISINVLIFQYKNVNLNRSFKMHKIFNSKYIFLIQIWRSDEHLYSNNKGYFVGPGSTKNIDTAIIKLNHMTESKRFYEYFGLNLS